MLPHVVREGDLKEYRDTFRCLKEIGLGGFLIRNLESFSFLKEMGMEKDIRLDYSVYTYNSRAQAFWQEQGVQRDTVPYELNEREIGKRDNGLRLPSDDGFRPVCPEEPERLQSQLFSGTLKRPDGKILPGEELLHLVLQCDLQQPSARPGKRSR